MKTESVIEFLWRIFCDTLWNWPIGTILCIAISLFVVLLILFLLSRILNIIDSWFLSEINGTGSIKKKGRAGPYEYSSYNVIHNRSIPVCDYFTYTLYILVDGKIDSIEVDEKYFNSIEEGQIINISYTIGRISENLCLKSITFADKKQFEK